MQNVIDIYSRKDREINGKIMLKYKWHFKRDKQRDKRMLLEYGQQRMTET